MRAIDRIYQLANDAKHRYQTIEDFFFILPKILECQTYMPNSWRSSKLEDLGNLFPKDGTPTPGCITWMENAFPYTPCWMGVP
jgi:hypothetical protein